MVRGLTFGLITTASFADLKDVIELERDTPRGPNPATARLAAMVDSLAGTVAKLGRRIEDLKTPAPAPPPPTKDDPQPETKLNGHVVKKPPLTWNTGPISAKAMPPCGRGLVTIEILPDGTAQAFACPHCRGATFLAMVVGLDPLSVQTSRPK